MFSELPERPEKIELLQNSTNDSIDPKNFHLKIVSVDTEWLKHKEWAMPLSMLSPL